MRLFLVLFVVGTTVVGCNKAPEPAAPPPPSSAPAESHGTAADVERENRSKAFVEQTTRSRQSKVEFDAAGNSIKR